MGVPEYCPISRRQAISNIIDSVAQEQAALANLLDAEGDKIKKLACQPHVCPEALLAANKSAQKTLNAVSHLETVLQSKLELFEDCLCPRPEHHEEPGDAPCSCAGAD